jgi:hypothetical protein
MYKYMFTIRILYVDYTLSLVKLMISFDFTRKRILNHSVFRFE